MSDDFGRYQIGATSLRERMTTALSDDRLRGGVPFTVDRFGSHSGTALAEFDHVDDVDDEGADGLRHAARAVRQQVLARLPAVLERFADAATASGAHVYWASNAVEARDYVSRVVRAHDAERVVKSRSTVTEEIQLTRALETRGTEVVETDRGGWVVPNELVGPGRDRRRDLCPSAEVGITGADLAVAETGSLVLLTNEGTTRLVTSLPPVHVAMLGMERLAANWAQADLLLALLARTASGAPRLSSSSTILTGPRGTGELGGPDELHIVVLDNGRSRLLAGEHHEMLGCTHCGAYVDVRPIPRQVGGHAYLGKHQPEPSGAVFAPLLAPTDLAYGDAVLAPPFAPIDHGYGLTDAPPRRGTSLDTYPVAIPSQDLLLSSRRTRAPEIGGADRTAWRLWATAWSDPQRFAATTRAATWASLVAGLAGRLPVAGSWADERELPEPDAERFRDRWRKGLV